MRITAMALANALLRVLSSHSSACSSSSSSLSSSRKKKASIATKHSSSRLGRRVIASSSSSSSSSSPERTNRSPRRRKKGREPLMRAILEPCVLEPRSMDESDDNGETEKMITKKTRKRTTMTSKDREDEHRSAATIVETDFLVRFILSSI